MRSRLVLAALACLLIAAAPASAQRQRANESWGKPGISYLQYRTDAVECAYVVGQEAPVEYPLVDLIFSDNMPGASPAASGGGGDISLRQMLDTADPEPNRMSRPWREITNQLRPALTQCLTERGYHRFRLTKDEVQQLRKLPAGTRARNVYLWNLSVASKAR